MNVGAGASGQPAVGIHPLPARLLGLVGHASSAQAAQLLRGERVLVALRIELELQLG